MENYRLKRSIVTDFIKERMPTLCEVEKPLNWWLSNRIVPNADDLEPCVGECSNENSGLHLQRVSGSALDIAKQIPQVPQTQAALNDQLKILRIAANKLGLYDAADFIKRD